MGILWQNQQDLVVNRLSFESRKTLEAVLKKYPQWSDITKMTSWSNDDQFDFLIEVVSPTKNDDVCMGVFTIGGGEEPSVGLGGWHTHCSDVFELHEYIDKIINDKIVLLEFSDTDVKLGVSVVDLTDSGDLGNIKHQTLNMLTEKDAPGEEVWLASWSGKYNHNINIKNIDVFLDSF